MLDEFRSIDITWDKANKRIYDNVKAVSSDEQGRKLVVQILNNNQVEDLTGASLNLFWETHSKHYQGLDLFDVVDAEKGIFEIYFTTGMLSNVGRLNAHLHLLDDNGAITSELFKIHVSKGIDTEAVESEDSFSTLTEALNRVVEIETQEQERIDNETDRKSAEVDRKNNETTREENETDRKEHETQRKSAETNRINAETARENNENTRESNETTRVNNETNRETTFATLKDEAEGLVDDLDEKYEGFEHEYAPRLDEIEDDISDMDEKIDENFELIEDFADKQPVKELIEENDNLNDYKTDGLYQAPTNAVVNSLENVPSGGSLIFGLMVFEISGNFIVQFFTTYGATRLFYRVYYNSWSDWVRIHYD